MKPLHTLTAVLLSAGLSATAVAAQSVSAEAASAAVVKQPPLVTAALTELAQRQAEEDRIAKNLETFDTLDFEVFSGQQWDRLHESHADDILVHWPDGRTVRGIDAHIDDLKAFFVFAPDTVIDKHPIRIGQGEWTGVVGEISGTFTEPMPVGDGQVIEPTGKRYALTMATIGHWTEEGVMDEEYLFWDNNAFYRQIGLID
ncbi:ester cyclase [Salipiger abyssi]|uniref:ester cyclase n=1 Tax=Salipiger abyssi TaxID=1250539 RepID=UPI001A8CA6E1|nr:ester cyclase [Salipiger abyssi]MBN9886835.1 ester cyclase [Salipiger abyssi]